MLQTAAALARATAAHLAEEMRERRRDGVRSTRELVLLVPCARILAEQLAALATAEGGQL